jgi:uncharacterized membrane protein YgaE (UPF0421/DUF939 family)
MSAGRDRVAGWIVAAVLAVVVGALVWSQTDNMGLAGLILVIAVLAAAGWDAIKGRR